MATQGCPCGYYNSVLRSCVCSPPQIQRYLSRISGPLLDRIDLHVDVPEVKYRELTSEPDGEPSRTIAERVGAARRRQMERFRAEGILWNSQMGPRQLRRFCRLELLELLGQKMGRGGTWISPSSRFNAGLRYSLKIPRPRRRQDL